MYITNNNIWFSPLNFHKTHKYNLESYFIQVVYKINKYVSYSDK